MTPPECSGFAQQAVGAVSGDAIVLVHAAMVAVPGPRHRSIGLDREVEKQPRRRTRLAPRRDRQCRRAEGKASDCGVSWAAGGPAWAVASTGGFRGIAPGAPAPAVDSRAMLRRFLRWYAEIPVTIIATNSLMIRFAFSSAEAEGTITWAMRCC